MSEQRQILLKSEKTKQKQLRRKPISRKKFLLLYVYRFEFENTNSKRQFTFEQNYEARINFLRKKIDNETSSSNDDRKTQDNGIITDQRFDLFADYESKAKKIKPMDEEKRLEQEKYEKQIGYLTYLGQDSNEALKQHNWYDVAPKKEPINIESSQKVEVSFKTKQRYDPMVKFLKNPIINEKKSHLDSKTEELGSKINKRGTSSESNEINNRILDKKRKKNDHHKEKHKNRHFSRYSSSEKDLKEHNINVLREKRLQRELMEQKRTNELLMKKFPGRMKCEGDSKETLNTNKTKSCVKQKYNSQFNPDVARQNYM